MLQPIQFSGFAKQGRPSDTGKAGRSCNNGQFLSWPLPPCCCPSSFIPVAPEPLNNWDNWSTLNILTTALGMRPNDQSPLAHRPKLRHLWFKVGRSEIGIKRGPEMMSEVLAQISSFWFCCILSRTSFCSIFKIILRASFVASWSWSCVLRSRLVFCSFPLLLFLLRFPNLLRSKSFYITRCLKSGASTVLQSGAGSCRDIAGFPVGEASGPALCFGPWQLLLCFSAHQHLLSPHLSSQTHHLLKINIFSRYLL